MNEPMDAKTIISHLPAHAARTLAVKILLSDIEWLQDDVLESCLYLLEERLAAPEKTGSTPVGTDIETRLACREDIVKAKVTATEDLTVRVEHLEQSALE